jgi:hypothetical protein
VREESGGEKEEERRESCLYSRQSGCEGGSNEHARSISPSPLPLPRLGRLAMYSRELGCDDEWWGGIGDRFTQSSPDGRRATSTREQLASDAAERFSDIVQVPSQGGRNTSPWRTDLCISYVHGLVVDVAWTATAALIFLLLRTRQAGTPKDNERDAARSEKKSNRGADAREIMISIQLPSFRNEPSE